MLYKTPDFDIFKSIVVIQNFSFCYIIFNVQHFKENIVSNVQTHKQNIKVCSGKC